MHKSKKDNIINLKSEILFREAEDDFLYFNKIKKAQNKLDKAIELTPFHHKSLVLKGDLLFIKGKTDEAFKLYKRAESVFCNNAKILASIANCLEVKKDYNQALTYCNKAFMFLNEDNCQLSASLFELKTSVLLKLKRYEEAKRFVKDAKYKLSMYEISTLRSHKEVINLKLKLKEKLKITNLQVL